MSAHFVWWDLNSKQLDEALAFYTGLFGWKTEAWTPAGAPDGTPPLTMLKVGEQPFATAVAFPADAPAPSHWTGHVGVTDLDAAVARATAAGGTFPRGTTELPTVGRMAMMMDPEHCVVSLFQPDGDMPEAVSPGEHGAVGWNEVGVADVETMKAFYSDVVGWTWQAGPNQDVMEYYTFRPRDAEAEAGGLYKRPPEMPMSAWMQYFTTTDLDATVAKIGELGGQVMHEPFEVPDTGRMTFATAPDGSGFGVAQWAATSGRG